MVSTGISGGGSSGALQVSTIDDKYADLPARVSHLEAVVFAPKQR